MGSACSSCFKEEIEGETNEVGQPDIVSEYRRYEIDSNE